MLGHAKGRSPTICRGLWLLLASVLLAACGGAPPARTYTIGVVNYVPVLELEPLGTVLDIAVKRGIATGTNEHAKLKARALVSYAGSFPAMGEQAARLVEQIFTGSRPADLPVETAEGFLHINLQTATAIDLDIPDGILRLADMVMR